MSWPSRKLPSMSALRALDAVARQGTLWAAGRELNRTPSAVSHQMRFLEQELGAPLFSRAGQSIELTPFGRRYAEEVHKALDLIAHAAELIDDAQLSGALTISCTPGFATFWLCGHLNEFRSLYPLIRLRLVTPRRLNDVSDPDADVFIAFGSGSWPNRSAELLANVAFAPICSPSLLNAYRLRSPEDLAGVTLLHLHDYEDWAMWLGARGLPLPPPEQGIILSDIYLAQAAAIAGQGIAMGDDIVCGQALADGLLVRPFEEAIPSPDAYFLVCERDRREHPVISAFCNWLKASLSAHRPIAE